MSYLNVVNSFRSIAAALNPSGVFEHCRSWDASLEFSSPNCHIFLYPLRWRTNKKAAFIDRYSVVMCFYFQDAPDSTNQQREIIIASAKNLWDSFYIQLDSVAGFQLDEARAEPKYRTMTGTYSGIITEFQLTTSTNICATDTYLLNTDNMILTNTDGTPLQNT